VLPQEELHSINVDDALTKFSPTGPIQPCEYLFPVTNLTDAIATAKIFTSLVMATLGDIITLMGQDGDSGLIRGIAGVLSGEGEQNGYYRQFEGLVPSELPFLTAGARDYAFSAINQLFIVQGSCPNIDVVDLTVFEVLTVETSATQIQDEASKGTLKSLEFSMEIPKGGIPSEWGSNCDQLKVVYINQQNAPTVVEIEDIDINVTAGTITFTAAFVFDEISFGNGLTIAAVALASGDLTTVDGCAAATKAGPGLIYIN